MKKVKLAVALFMIASLIVLQAIPSISAVSITPENASDDSSASPISIISKALEEHMAKAAPDDLIPVTIELKDNIDLDFVEQQSIKQANISDDEHAILTADTSDMDEKEVQEHQLAALAIRNRIYSERNAILKEYYTNKNHEFIEKNGLSDAKIGSIGIFTPFIRESMLTVEQIKLLAEHPEVCYMDYAGKSESVDIDSVSRSADFPSINDTYQIINGNVAINNGYTGSGINVGLVESGHPITDRMGNDNANVFERGGISNDHTSHATMTSGIIKKLAPGCNIYTRTAEEDTEIIAACSYLINEEHVHVINLSCGKYATDVYNASSREMDTLVRNTKVTIVVAVGNNNRGGIYVNRLGLAPNVITVGAVVSSGTEQSNAGAYTFADYSSYKESKSVVNKPEVCAPGNVTIYSYSDSGTSFATPHVTGTIVQMMSRNVGLSNKPETLKAILMASASYNAGTATNYVRNTTVSNMEGAGVIDAGFCYQVASMGRRTHFDANATTNSFSHDVYCDTTTIPFRIACAWDTTSTVGEDGPNSVETYNTDFDMYIYKNGACVASSTAYSNTTSYAKTNYEIVELSTSTLSTYGAGYYQVVIKIKDYTDYQGDGSVRIGLAWEQR